jgi:hypothetical protein
VSGQETLGHLSTLYHLRVLAAELTVKNQLIFSVERWKKGTKEKNVLTMCFTKFSINGLPLIEVKKRSKGGAKHDN